MSKKVVTTPNAPAPIGFYCQGLIANGFVYTSGQLPIDPATGAMPEGAEAQARQSLNNMKAIVEAAGSSMDKVVRVGIFLKDMNDFAVVDKVYGTFFKEGHYPCRSTVQVARLPKDALLEMDIVALA